MGKEFGALSLRAQEFMMCMSFVGHSLSTRVVSEMHELVRSIVALCLAE